MLIKQRVEFAKREMQKALLPTPRKRAEGRHWRYLPMCGRVWWACFLLPNHSARENATGGSKWWKEMPVLCIGMRNEIWISIKTHLKPFLSKTSELEKQLRALLRQDPQSPSIPAIRDRCKSWPSHATNNPRYHTATSQHSHLTKQDTRKLSGDHFNRLRVCYFARSRAELMEDRVL